tara:strand:+ start:398 stop:877 length:480 start_codon:yes stop_codon:yes gene_type:complete
MNESERLNLTRMIKEYDADDNTEKIRRLAHSSEIRKNVFRLMDLKQKYHRLSLSNKEQFKTMVISQCGFLYENYTNIFNKLLKGECNPHLMIRFCDVLRTIEEGEKDQHEASYEVGKILKSIYVDGALQRKTSGKGGEKAKRYRCGKKMSWSDYKQKNL